MQYSSYVDESTGRPVYFNIDDPTQTFASPPTGATPQANSGNTDNSNYRQPNFDPNNPADIANMRRYTQIAAHPEWTDQQVAQYVLQNGGANFQIGSQAPGLTDPVMAVNGGLGDALSDFGGYVSDTGGAGGLFIGGALGALNSVGALASLGGSAVPADSVSLGAGAGGAASSLPSNYFSMTADGGNIANDAAVANAGTIANNAPFATNAVADGGLANTGTSLLSNIPAGATTLAGGAASALTNAASDAPIDTNSGPSGPGDTPPVNNAPGQVTGDVPVAPSNILSNAGVGTSALAKLLGVSDATAQLLGAGGTTLAGILGAQSSANTLQNIYNQQRSDRAPALAAYNGALANPNTFYQSAPAMGAATAAANALSTKGNPADNPGLTAQLAANQLGGYNSYLSGLAGPAFGGDATQASLGGALANTSNQTANAVAGGLGNLSTPTTDLTSLLNSLSKINLTNGATGLT